MSTLHLVCFSPRNLLCTSAQGMGEETQYIHICSYSLPCPSLKRMDQGTEPGPVQMSYMPESYLCFLGRCWGALNEGHCHLPAVFLPPPFLHHWALYLVFPMQSLSLRTDWRHSQAPESFSADLTDQSWSVHSIVSCLGLVKINVRMVLCVEHFPTEPSPGPCLHKPSVSPNENCYSSLLSPLFLT